MAGPTADPAPGEPLLEVRDLVVGLRTRGRQVPLVHGIDMVIRPGERVGIAGESGSGKSLTMLAVMGLLAPPLAVLGGSIRLAGLELVGAPEQTLRRARGTDMAMIYQDPMTSLDPMQRIGTQVGEGLRAHGVSQDETQRRVLSALAEVRLPAPERVMRLYPHQLSGGMRQRVMIASALVGEPRLLIADEPTTALDVTIQRDILLLVARLQATRKMAVAWISHDLGLLAQFAQRMVVMYAGRAVETADTRSLFSAPQHPYSAALLSALPTATHHGGRLPQIGGLAADPASLPSGCAFHPRCIRAASRCVSEVPAAGQAAGTGSVACWFPLGRPA